ncbi:MAG: dicarboxylate/amino acid:cation symporter [Bacteroidota bacterium]
MFKKIPLYLQILTGIVIGIIWGICAVCYGFQDFTLDFIKPFGTIFMNLLKLIAIPLIIASLISGISGLSAISNLSRIGFKTISIYLITTAIAVCIGLLLVNITRPGEAFSKQVKEDLLVQFQEEAQQKQVDAVICKETGPLQFLVEIVPENLISATSENKNMLQVIFFSILFGIAMMVVPSDKTKEVVRFFNGLNAIILKIIDIIMLVAPIGVLALFAGIIVEVAGDSPEKTIQLFSALGLYLLTVVIGLIIMVLIIYPLVIIIFTRQKPGKFLKGIFPAQMLAFSTSSSAATLPVTMECCEENLKVNKEVSSFVLPLGATVNMDGTSLYQAVAAVFIAQAFGMDLSLMQQLTIVLTATLASIGSAAVPGAGIIMLIVVLESIGVPAAGIALVFAVDRPLDMLRTTVNVTGDATVCSIVQAGEDRRTKKGF